MISLPHPPAPSSKISLAKLSFTIARVYTVHLTLIPTAFFLLPVLMLLLLFCFLVSFSQSYAKSMLIYVHGKSSQKLAHKETFLLR